jgi:hypothetical protein
MGSTKKKRSWRDKLADSKDFPKVAEIDCTKTKRWGEGTFVIPAPLEVDAAMKKVRRGKLTTIDAIRKALATKHSATIACPITPEFSLGSLLTRPTKQKSKVARGSRPIGAL